MRNVKGSVIPKRWVPCSGKCGEQVLRAVHFADAKCARCRQQGKNERYRAWLARVRVESRRFRIVCHVLGWEPEDFAEMLEEMKRSPMMFRTKWETKKARRDWREERRAEG